MIFSSKAIKSAIEAGALSIEPYDENAIKHAHVDLHFEVPGGNKEITIPARGFQLAKTLEKITTDQRTCAFMEGRASLAKQGISIEQSSTFIEPGSDNQMTLEIFNASDKDVVLTSNQPIAKMFVMRVVDHFE